MGQYPVELYNFKYFDSVHVPYMVLRTLVPRVKTLLTKYMDTSIRTDIFDC